MSKFSSKRIHIAGVCCNDNRIRQLGEVIRIMKRTQNALDSQQVLNVIQKYSKALELLDSLETYISPFLDRNCIRH